MDSWIVNSPAGCRRSRQQKPALLALEQLAFLGLILRIRYRARLFGPLQINQLLSDGRLFYPGGAAATEMRLATGYQCQSEQSC